MMAEVSSDQDSHHGQQRPSSSSLPIVVGGAVDAPCYCLLDGCLLLGGDTENDPQANAYPPRVRVAITRLPAKLGRRHDTTDPHFCSLGTAKALSREHVRIDYRVPKKQRNQEDGGGTSGGGYLQSNDDPIGGGGCGFRLVPQDNDEEDDDDDDDDDNETSGGDKSKKKKIPSTGAYVITCLSKNRIMVDQERIDQDQTTILRNGAAIKIGPVCVYFLLPAEPQQQQNKESPQSVPSEPHVKPQHRWSLDVSSAMPVAAKSMMSSTSREESMGSKATGSTAAGGGGPGGSNVHLQLEALSWHDLANEYHKAKTERRKQIVQSVIVARGALDAAVALCPNSTNNDDHESDDDDNEDDDNNATTNEYAANDIIAWLEGSEKYGPFQNEMKDRMEPKSYKASITKALLRAGFVRNNALGPRVRWHLPASILRRKRRELLTMALAKQQQHQQQQGADDDDDAASASSYAPMEEDNDNNGIEEEDDDDNDNQDGNDDDSMEE
jgi:hypothetical protein